MSRWGRWGLRKYRALMERGTGTQSGWLVSEWVVGQKPWASHFHFLSLASCCALSPAPHLMILSEVLSTRYPLHLNYLPHFCVSLRNFHLFIISDMLLMKIQVDLKISKALCLCTCVWAYVPWPVCGDQRTTLGGQLSPSTLCPWESNWGH